MPPVAAFAAAIATTVSTAVASTSAFFAGLGFVGQAVGSLALSIGLNYVASLLSRPQQTKPSNVQIETKQAVPPRQFHYGKVKVSGPLAFWESRNGNLHKVILLSSREIDAVEEIYLDDKAVTLNAAGEVTSGHPSGDKSILHPFLGTSNQAASPELMEAFSDQWTSNHRLRGTAYIHAVAKGTSAERFSGKYPNGEPSVSALIRGVKVFDPRTNRTAYSDNVALCILDYLTHPDGYNRPIEKLDLQSFRDHADLCDEIVNGKKRYVLATTVNYEEPRKDTLQRLLEASNSDIYESTDGRIAIRGGKWEDPVIGLDDEMGHILSADFSPPSALDRYNQLTIAYREPKLGYVETAGRSWEDPDDIAATGVTISNPFEVYQVPDEGQARRLAKIRMARDNADWTAEIVTTLAGLSCIGEPIMNLRFSELSIDAPFWIESLEISPNFDSVSMKLRSASKASFDWSVEEEGQSISIPPDTSPAFDLDPPAFTLSQGIGQVITCSWTPSPALNRYYDVQYQAAGSNTWTALTVADSRDRATSGTVSPGIYQVRMRVSAGPQAVGEWSQSQAMTIV